MTCIVAVKDGNGRVIVAGDTLGSSNWDSLTLKNKKVFNLSKEVAIGYTQSYRFGQIVEFHLPEPVIEGDELTWMVRTFIPKLREVLKENGWLHVENRVESGGTMIVAVRDRIFKVAPDFQVIEPDYDYASCGCGESYALGSLFTTGATGRVPLMRVHLALSAAAQFSNGCNGKFSAVYTKRQEKQEETKRAD